jgi:hypothetical protein
MVIARFYGAEAVVIVALWMMMMMIQFIVIVSVVEANSSCWGVVGTVSRPTSHRHHFCQEPRRKDVRRKRITRRNLAVAAAAIAPIAFGTTTVRSRSTRTHWHHPLRLLHYNVQDINHLNEGDLLQQVKQMKVHTTEQDEQ